MYTVEQLDEQLSDLSKEDRVTKLKEICEMESIKFHHMAGEDKLKTLIVEHYNASEDGDEAEYADTELDSSGERVLRFKDLDRYPDETEAEYKVRKRKEAHKLVRVRVSCMNPMKKEFQGEYFTFGNDVVGTITRYIPFQNVETHVEQVFLEVLRGRKFQEFKRTGKLGEIEKKEGYLINEFAIEVLPPLTEKELKDLADQQKIANRIG